LIPWSAVFVVHFIRACYIKSEWGSDVSGLIMFSTLRFLYLSFSKIAESKCVSELSFADPIQNATLLQVQLIIRHGSRSPGDDYYNSGVEQEWICDDVDSIAPRINPAPVKYPRNYRDELDPRLVKYRPSCREKDLLVLGMQQHYELGTAYKKHYIQDLNFLPENYNPDFVLIRTSQRDRTLRSAISFIQGMFPPVSPNEVVSFLADTEAAGVVHPSDSWCVELTNISKYMRETEPFISIFNNFSRKHEAKYNSTLPIKKWNAKNMKNFCAWLIMTDCSKHTIPSNLTQEFQDDCVDLLRDYAFIQHDNDKYRGVASAPLFREMFRIADEHISLTTPYRFVLFSSHDTAITAYLTTLGYDYHNQPPVPVRSHLALELWEINNDVYGRYVYNGKPIKIPFLENKDVFLYTNLKLAMKRSGWLDHCMIPEWR